MGRDKSLGDNHPSVIIGDTQYHYGREPEYGQYLVENANIAKDYWCFDTKKDLVAFLVNLPESADRNRRSTLHPDWHEVTHEQRLAYFAEDLARLRVLAAAKMEAGTARTFNMDLEGREGPHAPRRLDEASTTPKTLRDTVSVDWAKRAGFRDHPASVRVGGGQYFVHPEDSTFPFRGFGGAEFCIKFGDGRLVRSTNLWFSGKVPEAYRGQLPDNAEFVGKDEFRRLIGEKATREKAVGREREGRGPSRAASPVEGRRDRPKQEHEPKPPLKKGPGQSHGPKPRLKKGHGQGL